MHCNFLKGVLLDTKFGVSLPLMIFGAFGLSAGVLSFFLPETSNISLPQTVEDAEKIKRYVFSLVKI